MKYKDNGIAIKFITDVLKAHFFLIYGLYIVSKPYATSIKNVYYDNNW
jgi:hypothetical protein